MTDRVLREFQTSGSHPHVKAGQSVKQLLAGASRGSYLAITAYLRQTPAVDRAANVLRREILRRYGLATTFGYGPRYLHSTGQLHKAARPRGFSCSLRQINRNMFPSQDIHIHSISWPIPRRWETCGHYKNWTDRSPVCASILTKRPVYSDLPTS